ncbi:MAG: radical SAM protein, partial [Proteobacteria bacterium]|nr:radical SAM protein [Pseudomonadota bacterium]
LVGLSLDGPAEIHDAYRVRPGGGSHDQAMRAAGLMQTHGVEFNILAMLTDRSVGRPEEVYRFFRRHGFDYLQFITCFEWAGDRPARFSVRGRETGEFYGRLFDLWMADGFPEVSIRLFEDILIFFFDRVRVSCGWMERCDSYLVVEHNGDCYPCDFFVEPGWRLGNLVTDELSQILASPRRGEFAAQKSRPPAECRDCLLLPFCQGDCPRYRRGPGGDYTGVSEFCVALKMLVHHMEPSLPRIMDEVGRRRPR